jgi:hypothetical protein
MFDIKQLEVIDGEPGISDVDLARALGLSDAQMVRDIIEQCEPELKGYGAVAPRWIQSTDKRSRPVEPGTGGPHCGQVRRTER